MMPLLRTIHALAVLAALASTAEAQRKTHTVSLEADRGQEIYRFSPAKVTVSPGDVIVFKAAAGSPHGVAFESEGLAPAAVRMLSAAMGNRPGNLRGPTMVKDGDVYRLAMPALPPGVYRIFCLPHRAYHVRGEIVVRDK